MPCSKRTTQHLSGAAVDGIRKSPVARQCALPSQRVFNRKLHLDLVDRRAENISDTPPTIGWRLPWFWSDFGDARAPLKHLPDRTAVGFSCGLLGNGFRWTTRAWDVITHAEHCRFRMKDFNKKRFSAHNRGSRTWGSSRRGEGLGFHREKGSRIQIRYLEGTYWNRVLEGLGRDMN